MAGIGQYIDQVNALTFMRAMGRIAGGGTGADPYLMAKITRGEKTAYEAKTETSSRALKAETAAKLTEYLRNNVATMYGDWQFGGLNVCAKSGTAEHEGETADAMFAGFCVDENCPLAFVVFVENGGSGSAVAAQSLQRSCRSAPRQTTDKLGLDKCRSFVYDNGAVSGSDTERPRLRPAFDTWSSIEVS